MKLKGKVFKKKAGIGSKSEHEGIYIRSHKGEFQLQEKGGNFFANKKLAGLVGTTVELEGRIYDNRFMVDSAELDAAIARKK